MSGKKQIANLHSSVTANAAQFIDEFNRADNVAKRVASNITKEVEGLAKKTAKKFTLGDIGKDVLKGAGLFGGFAIFDTIRDKVVEHFREQAELAKAIEESTARQLDITRQIIALRQTDPQKLSSVQQQFTDAGRDLEAARRQKFKRSYKGGVGLDAFSLVDDPTRPRARTKEEEEQVLKLTEQYAKLGLELDKLKLSARDVSVGNMITDFFHDLDESMRKIQDNPKFLSDSISELNDLFKPLEDAAHQFKTGIQTPLDKFTTSLNEMRHLRELGLISGADVDRGIKLAQRKLTEDSEPNMSRWEKAMGVVKADEFTRRGLGSGGNYETVNAKQSNVLGEIRDLLRRAIAGGYVPGYAP